MRCSDREKKVKRIRTVGIAIVLISLSFAACYLCEKIKALDPRLITKSLSIILAVFNSIIKSK